MISTKATPGRQRANDYTLDKTRETTSRTANGAKLMPLELFRENRDLEGKISTGSDETDKIVENDVRFQNENRTEESLQQTLLIRISWQGNRPQSLRDTVTRGLAEPPPGSMPIEHNFQEYQRAPVPEWLPKWRPPSLH